MLGRLIRVILALTAIAPLAVSLTYIYSKQNKLALATVAFFGCVLLGAGALKIIGLAGNKLERLPVKIKKVKSADKEVVAFFVAYALPLVFRGQATPEIEAWLLGGGMLLFVLWSTHSLQVNPVLGLFGYHFYDVETDDGITYLMISRRTINRVQSVNTVVQLSEYGILEAPQTGQAPR